MTQSPASRDAEPDQAIRNALTVDVEDYFHVSALAETIDRGDWHSMEFRADASTDRLLALFDEFDVKGTFFVLGWLADKCPEVVRRIHAAGHEVACHGFSHQLVYNQTPEEFREETRRSKALLEDTTGAPVIGYRAASWSITERSLWALDVIHELGFEYDSSIFPIRHDRYGIPGAPRYPGTVESPAGHAMVEFPPSTTDIAGMRLPVSGGGYFRIFPYALTRYGLGKVNRQARQPFMFYLHPWEVDPEQPRFEARWLSRFRHYTNLARTESRLRRLLTEFEFTTTREVLRDLGLLAVRDQVTVSESAVC